ncbi:tetratricopeptide repeat protein [Rhodococcus sp. MS16]|uniref:protein kinase domain-containing protein n=1 Tax=Rhodococcus sp. MS16 TaxID=2579941 RepID=UPI001562D919|nr:protein kinase [Rhodococcus sp. MS16]NRI70047.1 tetratricopeptide repeat protein [Rhodococcus sp. MS16]
MTDYDPHRTQHDVTPALTTELSAAGFANCHEIGSGGFGVVYRCAQSSLERTVALKILTTDLDDENRARFFREQQAMGRLTGHPNIVDILHVGTTDSGRPYIVMPYHPHGSLEERIRREGPLDLDEALRIGVKIAGALETAHRLGIIHRDVKPANILLTEYAGAALTDFGIAHISGGFKTAAGTVTGSPAFTAPEVLKGEPPSPASDIYGLAATLFCVLTGHAAFERQSGEQVVAQFLRITTQPVPDLRDQGIPDEVSAVIEHGMSFDPAERPHTAANFGDELRQVQLAKSFPVEEMALPAAPGEQDRKRDPLRGHTPSKGNSSVRPRPSTASPVWISAGKLPVELTSFIDRRREQIEVREKLSVSRLVTLTGIGGVGKTRLALRVAAGMQRGFSDGVRLVELGEMGEMGEMQDSSLLVDLVAAALGIRNQSARPLEDVVMDFLASRHLLLVLDNCEHMVDAVADLVRTLLRHCPELRILATSRELLGVGGESVSRVPPLTVPDPEHLPSMRGVPQYDAMTLFAERATAVVPGFELTEDNRETVAQICHQLDGLPLPIELAAARMRAMSAEQILARLTDRYQLLTLSPRGAPTRQQTLQLSVDWSYELCDPREQQMWARLSVFVGGFELDAAEGICAGDSGPGMLLDVVTSLVDKSILISEQAGDVVRFRMLEILRDYGRKKSELSGEYLTLRRLHRDWYQKFALDAESQWISPHQLEWIARIERELPNLRAAMKFGLTSDSDSESESGLQIAAALLPYWMSRGPLREGRHWLDSALARHPRRPTPERINALYAGSALAGLQGDFRAATSLVVEGQELIRDMTDPASHARIAQADGVLALYSGDLSRACTRLQEARGGVGAPERVLLTEVSVLQGLGWVHELQGEPERAVACYERVLEITESHGESVYRSYALWAMAVTAWRQGDVAQSIGKLKQGLRLTRLVDDPLMAATYLESLSWIDARTHDAQRAAILMGSAESLRRAVGSSTVMFSHLIVYREESERAVRHALGDRKFESAYKMGRALSFDEAVAYALGEQPSTPSYSAAVVTTLTKREQQVADLVTKGMTNKAIASQLVISQRTAQGHVEHILVKLGFTSRAQIAAWVAEQKHDTA